MEPGTSSHRRSSRAPIAGRCKPADNNPSSVTSATNVGRSTCAHLCTFTRTQLAVLAVRRQHAPQGSCLMVHVTESEAWKLDRIGSARAGTNPTLLAKMPQSFAVIG